MKIVAFIPARLESKRFPNKVIKKIFELPMIEHVRRRAKISNIFNKIIIVTNSLKIKKILNEYKAKVILSKKKHYNGTSRAAEVSKNFNYDFAFVLFSDEPFIDPKKIRICKNKIKSLAKFDVINVTTNIKKNDLRSRQVVKCVIDKDKRIINYFRTKKNYNYKKNTIQKSSGILIFKKKTLQNFTKLKLKKREKKDKIEQFRFLENNLKVGSIFIKNIIPSINNKTEYAKTVKFISSNRKQMQIVKQVLNNEHIKL